MVRKGTPLGLRDFCLALTPAVWVTEQGQFQHGHWLVLAACGPGSIWTIQGRCPQES